MVVQFYFPCWAGTHAESRQQVCHFVSINPCGVCCKINEKYIAFTTMSTFSPSVNKANICVAVFSAVNLVNTKSYLKQCAMKLCVLSISYFLIIKITDFLYKMGDLILTRPNIKLVIAILLLIMLLSGDNC